jgi:hypothetical protein
MFDLDNVNPTKVKSVWVNNRAVIGSIGVGATTIDASATATLDADGFTLTWSPNDAGTPEIVYLAMGDAGSQNYPISIESRGAVAVNADATGYYNQRKVDRCQNGVLWAFAPITGSRSLAGYYSVDHGQTWNYYGGIGDGNVNATNSSIFIDIDDYVHVVWKQVGSVGGRTDGYLYYMRGTPNAGRTSWTWSASNAIQNVVAYNYPDIVAHREGTGWVAHSLQSYMVGTQSYVSYRKITIDSGGTITVAANLDIGGDYVSSSHTYPSLDFNHTGDGKTVAGGTPHLYAAWNAGATGTGKGLRFRKAVYSAGVWTWNTEREIDSTIYWQPGAWGNCLFDGTRVVIVSESGSTGWNTTIYERDAADTTTTTRALVVGDGAAINGGLYNGSATYDINGNVYLIGGDWNGTTLRVRVFNRNTLTLGSAIDVGTITGAGNYPTFKRGASNNRVEWLWTAGNGSPYPIKYDNIVTTPIGLFLKRVKSATDLYRDKMRARGFNI